MTLKLYADPTATCYQRVALVCAEKNVPFELVPVDIWKGAHKKPEFLVKQPFGKVPFMEDDDGFTMFESRAIAKYIALKYADQGTKLMPATSDVKAFAKFEQGCSIESSYYDPAISALAYELIVKPALGHGASSPAALSELCSKLDGVFAVYDTILSKQKWICGDEFSFADLSHLPYGLWVLKKGGEEYEKIWRRHGNVWRWWSGMMEREASRSVFKGVYGE